MSKLEEMCIFMKVIEQGSFSKAANSLGVSPPTITRAINNLENKLGSFLFLRSSRIVQPTEAAEEYYNDCRLIIDSIEDAERKIKNDKDNIAGHLTITAPEYFSDRFIVPLIAEFSELYPNVIIKVITSNNNLNLIRDKINIAVRFGKLEDSFLLVTRVGLSKTILCASPEYLRTHGIPESPSELNSRTIISASEVTNNDMKLYFSSCQTSLYVKPTLIFNTKRAAIDTTIGGYGIAIMMSHYAKEYIQSKQLEVIFPDVQTEIVPISVLHSEGKEITRRTRTLYDFIVDGLRSNPALIFDA